LTPTGQSYCRLINRDVCFFAEDDYLFYLECLNDACEKHRVAKLIRELFAVGLDKPVIHDIQRASTFDAVG